MQPRAAAYISSFFFSKQRDEISLMMDSDRIDIDDLDEDELESIIDDRYDFHGSRIFSGDLIWTEEEQAQELDSRLRNLMPNTETIDPDSLNHL